MGTPTYSLSTGFLLGDGRSVAQPEWPQCVDTEPRDLRLLIRFAVVYHPHWFPREIATLPTSSKDKRQDDG
jgi:hypothetical protein